MTESNAVTKVCPFMTRPIHESPIGPDMSGVTITWYVNCMGNACMSWEPTIGEELLEGYCKLLEKDIE